MLPILQSKPTVKPITSGVGAYRDPCKTCSLRDVCVGGCCGSHGMCEQKTCHRECNTCGGGPLKEQDKGVPAVCSKAPLRDVYLSQVRKDRYNFTDRPLITFENHGFIVNQGSPGRVDRSPYPDETEAVAVNLRHVWSTRGWFSQDLRDYLRLPNKKTKLILLTATHDDVLERAWGAEVQHEDFAGVGFDYWQPIEFSNYGDMSRFNNIWQRYRTLAAIEASSAHFMTLMPHELRSREGEHIYAPFLEGAKAIPQLMVNWQFMTLHDKISLRWMISNVRKTLKRLPIKSVWFVGVSTFAMAYIIKKNFLDHRCYFVSVAPWLQGHKGAEFSITGKCQKSTAPKSELVLQNQRNYMTLMNEATRRAVEEAAQARSVS